MPDAEDLGRLRSWKPSGLSTFPICYDSVYWWDGEYEGTCELRIDHPPGIHYDGMSWWDDDDAELDLDDDVKNYIRAVYGPPRGVKIYA